MKNEDMTVREILAKYPDGAAISPGGRLSKTLFASSCFARVAQEHPIAPQNGGYLVVEMQE